MTSLGDSDHLPSSLREVVAAVVGRLGDDADRVLEQASIAQVISMTPTMIDLAVPDTMNKIRQADGPLPVRAFVTDECGRDVGELLVWVAGGKLVGLEQAWVTDQPPTEWPSTDRIRID
jgi:hypothetical protein